MTWHGSLPHIPVKEGMLATLSSRGVVGTRSVSVQATRTTPSRNRMALVKDRRYREQVVPE